MSIKSLSKSSLLNFEKYSSLLAGNDPYLNTSYFLLQTEVLPSTQSGVEFDVSSFSSTYQHLQLRTVLRSNRAGDTSSRARIRFNSDTGNNYSNHYVGGTGSTAFAGYLSQYPDRMINIDGVTASTAPAGAFGVAIYDILDPFESTKYTTMRFVDGQAQSFNRISLNVGVWKNTNPLTSILIEDEHGSFIQGSRFSLYGLKAA